MATARLEFDYIEGYGADGLTVKLFTPGADDAAVASVTADEFTNDPGGYFALLVDVATGLYRVAISETSGGAVVARGLLHHANAAGTEQGMDGGPNIATETTVIEVD